MREIDFTNWDLNNFENKLNNENGGVAWTNVKRSDITLMSHKKKDHGFIDFEHSFDFIVKEIRNFSRSSRVLFTLWKLKKSNGNVLSVYIDKYKGSNSEYRLVFYQRVEGENSFKSVSIPMFIGHRYNVSIKKSGEVCSMKVLWKEGTYFESGDQICADHKYDELIIAESHGFVVEPNCESSGFLFNLRWVKKEIAIERPQLDNPMSIFNGLVTHETIMKYSGGLFGDGHYTESVHAAFKQIEIMVKEKVTSVLPNESGKSLMGKAFNVKHPLLRINDLQTESDRNEQEGFCHLFMGSMQGIRNIAVHENIEIDAKHALHRISLANILAEIIDRSEIVNYSN